MSETIVSIRMPSELAHTLEKLALAESRSRSNMIRILLEQAVVEGRTDRKPRKFQEHIGEPPLEVTQKGGDSPSVSPRTFEPPPLAPNVSDWDAAYKKVRVKKS